jgi:RNA polymerase sigma factor (sigma-70 family)
LTTSTIDTVGHLLRELAPQVLGAVARRHEDFSDAEDAVQDAMIAATAQWPAEDVPENPRGWLYRVAMRRLADQARSESARRQREEVAASEFSLGASLAASGQGMSEEADDSLVLLFMCCHPSLSTSSAIALTLRAVGGLTTAEIASAFLVPEATLAQRISRAKQSIKASGVPFRMPGRSERASRLDAVLHVLYLIFNEGYTSSGGAELVRVDLSNEAIRLARALHAMLPDGTEAAGLLALMLLTDARRAARATAGGDLVPLDAQDRSLWNRAMINEGRALISATIARGEIGAYQLQAAIAAVHDAAGRAEDTDWAEILALYGLLQRVTDNPMVTLSRAVAAAMTKGPAAGLALLEPLDTDARIAGHYRLDAVRAHLLELSGDTHSAIAHYRAAAGKTQSTPERDYLNAKIARLIDVQAKADTDI